jgi:diguanylate cyclase (GGDEF)-like protein
MASETVADSARLAALRELGLLDTAPEEQFDRFTVLTAELLGVPISTMTLVDRDRQFFKSTHGLTGAWAAASEIPLSHSLCKHPVASGEPLVLADARIDPRLSDNLAVRDMSIVAYAGVPLVLRDGNAVGTLCAMDGEPHEWTERDLRILSDLAGAVSSILDMRRTLHEQTLHDPLTGLPNRPLTVAYGDQLSKLGDGGDLLAVAVAIDDLEEINDAHGVAQSDRLISIVARRIAHQLTTDDVLGRLGGDTFAVLRPRVADQAEARDLADRMRIAMCAEPVSIRGEQFEVSATVGMAAAAPGIDGDALVDRALASLADARSHDDRIAPSGHGGGEAIARVRMTSALAGAVRRGEISVNFQPIVELATGRTVGYEALARWQHPELGLVGPAEFIPVAESTGDIVLIGEHVLRSACTQLSLWRAMVPDDELGVTVNFSPLQLGVPNISDVVAGILAETGLPGTALTLEITEGVFISPGVLQRRNLEAIRELGVQIALDDFGTGYSALSYLKRFPVDMIKVDRCFLDGLETDRRDAALMRAILAIGTGMDLDVIAEGVETRAQRELLRLSGCHWGQGFLFAEPLPPEQIRIPGASRRFGPVLSPAPDEPARIVAAPQ